MSLLDKLFGGLFDIEDDSSQQIEHPCSNCPSSCTIAPDACSVCQPYKEQMIDAIYRVEHKDEIISRYEVVGTSASEGTVVCPNCGGHSENHYVCDYCGSKLQDGSGKIQVASAADIPNPVLEAQDIIFKRYDAVKGYAGADSGYGYEDALSGIGSQGLFSSIFNALLGSDSSSSDTNTNTIGKKMTEGEIEEMAKYYGASVSDYLTGLDNGKYLTLSNKSTAAAAEEKYTKANTSSQSGSMGDLAGLAGALGLGSMLFGGSTYNRSAARNPYQNRSIQSNPFQGMPGMGQQHPQQSQKAADPRLKNAGADQSMRAAQVKREAQERERLEAQKKAEQERKAAEAARKAQQQKEAQARKAEQERLARNAAAKANDRLDSGVGGVGRRPDPASARQPIHTASAAQSRTASQKNPNTGSLKDFQERNKPTQKSADAKAPGKATGMGRRPG